MASEQSTWYQTHEPTFLKADKSIAELAEIVVFVDGRTETAGIFEFSGVLAEEHGAQLIAVFMQPGPVASPSETFARGEGIVDVIEAHRAQLEGIEASHRTQFEDMVRRHGIRSEWRSLPYFGSDVGVHAHYADLALVARPASWSPSS